MEMIEIFGNRMYTDDSPVSRRLKKRGVYEPFETDLILKNLKRGDRFLDVGSHIGYYSLIASNVVGDEGMIYSIEPDINNYNLLLRNIAENRIKNIQTYCIAAFDRNIQGKIYLDYKNSGNHKLFQDRKDQDWTSIECMRLDNLLAGKVINFIKIDTQGAEVEVLNGLEETIKTNICKMMIEFYPYGLKGMGHNSLELLELLINYGFEIYNINKSCLGKLYKFRHFANRFQDGEFTNLYCVKEI